MIVLTPPFIGGLWIAFYSTPHIDAAILPRADIERRRREGQKQHVAALLAQVARQARNRRAA